MNSQEYRYNMDKPIWKYNIPGEYVTLLDDIKERTRSAQYGA